MVYVKRDYQEKAISTGINFYNDSGKDFNGMLILPTGSGKSLVIARIVKQLKGKTIVFQPSKEILEQNYAKFIGHGGKASIYSHSGGEKIVDTVTYATIGSVINKAYMFLDTVNIIIDECHKVNSEAGMYMEFIAKLKAAKVLGLTATPYRLETSVEGPILNFLNRSRPRIFSKVLYYVQNKTLFDQGHLAKLRYFRVNVVDRSKLEINAKGTGFTDASVRRLYRMINMPSIIIDKANKLLTVRKNLLIFCTLISEANQVASGIPGSVVLTGKTDPALRTKILGMFKAGVIRCVINVGVLTTGFDYPALECVLMARSTMSLALYYQIVGRIMRTHADKKEGWYVDLGGNIEKFGKVETMELKETVTGFFSLWNDGRKLTNVPFSRN